MICWIYLIGSIAGWSKRRLWRSAFFGCYLASSSSYEWSSASLCFCSRLAAFGALWFGRLRRWASKGWEWKSKWTAPSPPAVWRAGSSECPETGDSSLDTACHWGHRWSRYSSCHSPDSLVGSSPRKGRFASSARTHRWSWRSARASGSSSRSGCSQRSAQLDIVVSHLQRSQISPYWCRFVGQSRRSRHLSRASDPRTGWVCWWRSRFCTRKSHSWWSDSPRETIDWRQPGTPGIVTLWSISRPSSEISGCASSSGRTLCRAQSQNTSEANRSRTSWGCHVFRYKSDRRTQRTARSPDRGRRPSPVQKIWGVG